MSSLLLAGCGFVGRETARMAHAAGWQVSALTSSVESAHSLAAEPYRVIACDINNPGTLSKLGPFDAVIDCVSSGRGGADDYRRVYLEGARNLIRTVQPARFLFTSSTSVYAQTDDSLVTEESPAQPDRETGRILRETEETVLDAGGTVVRLAGLYGPGRWALLEQFLNGHAVLEGDGARRLNHTHRDDAAGALAMEYLPAAGYPLWKAELRDGHADPACSRQHLQCDRRHAADPIRSVYLDVRPFSTPSSPCRAAGLKPETRMDQQTRFQRKAESAGMEAPFSIHRRWADAVKQPERGGSAFRDGLFHDFRSGKESVSATRDRCGFHFS